MSRTNGAGQPSVDEILASIRASIAEEEVERETQAARASSERFRVSGSEPTVAEGHEFELPSMFRPALDTAPEKHTKLFGRLADALLGANGETPFDLNSARRIDLDAPPVKEPLVLQTAAPKRQSAPATQPPAEEVKRVMVAFGDTRMSKLGSIEQTASPAPLPIAQSEAATSTEPLAKGLWSQSEIDKPAQYQADGNATAQSHNGHETSPKQFEASNPQSSASAPSLTPPEVPPLAGQRPGIEDAAAQLLRPMLRQWLSDNMPKIVEQALRSEAADAVQPGSKPSGSNND